MSLGTNQLAPSPYECAGLHVTARILKVRVNRAFVSPRYLDAYRHRAGLEPLLHGEARSGPQAHNHDSFDGFILEYRMVRAKRVMLNEQSESCLMGFANAGQPCGRESRAGQTRTRVR